MKRKAIAVFVSLSCVSGGSIALVWSGWKLLHASSGCLESKFVVPSHMLKVPNPHRQTLTHKHTVICWYRVGFFIIVQYGWA